MTLDLNTVHLYRVSYGSTGRCTGSDSLYAKSTTEARRIASAQCSRHEKVTCIEKVVQNKII